MNNLFKEIRVWRRSSKTLAILYNCVENLCTGEFAVQSADYFKSPVVEGRIEVMSKQFLELFLEESPNDRCDWFKSLEEAVIAHDKYFS